MQEETTEQCPLCKTERVSGDDYCKCGYEFSSTEPEPQPDVDSLKPNPDADWPEGKQSALQDDEDWIKEHGQPKEDLPSELQTDKEENSLSILSWNIKMHPPPYGWFYNSIDKAENIIKTLKESSKYDVILFQEAFSYKIRNKIYNSLKDLYPYQIDIKMKLIIIK